MQNGDYGYYETTLDQQDVIDIITSDVAAGASSSADESIAQAVGPVLRDTVSSYLGPPTPPTEPNISSADFRGGGTPVPTGSISPAEIYATYVSALGRPPSDAEMASEIENSYKYSGAGIVRSIQLRGANVAGSNVRGDEFLPALTQDQVVSIMSSGGTGGPLLSGTEGWRDVVGGIVGLLPIPGAPQLGDIIAGVPSLAQPRLPMPAPPQARLPAPRTPPIIDIPIPSRGGGIGRGARAAAIAAAAAALGLSIEQYLAMNPGLRRRRHMNALNPRALRRAFSRVDAFGKFVKRTIRIEKHAPRPKKHRRK